jgi:hypothetical protein
MVLASVTACWTGQPPAQVATTHAISFPVQTCAVELPYRSAQQLVMRRWLGRIADRSWLVAERAASPRDRRLVLVMLQHDTLATIDLPFETLLADYVTGTKLWLAGTQDARTLLVELDLAARTPRLSATEWDTSALASVDALAVSDDRVLLAERDPVEHKFQLYDRGGKKLGPMVTMRSADPAAAKLRCSGERCFAVGIEGDERTRRAFVLRFAPGGGTENELLAGDRVANLQTAVFGDRTIVVWTALDRSGLFARSVDTGGRFVGGRVAIEGLPAAPLVFELLPASPPRIAVRDIHERWSIATLDVDARRVEDLRPLPLAESSFAGAVTADGVAGAGYSNRADQRVGVYGFTAHATAVFVPVHGDAEPAIEVLPPTSGEGRAGIAAFPLVAPGHAAVLVVPQGYDADAGGELVMLRTPCAR